MIRGLISLIICFFITPSYAQNYVPPPLFDAPQETSSSVRSESVKENMIPVIPKPSAKPSLSKPLAKQDVPPPPLQIQADTPSPQAPSKGSVSGPKTMPSVPAKSVETEILFEPEERTVVIQPPDTQEEVEKKETPTTPDEIVPPLPAFVPLSDGALKSTLYFVSHATDMGENNRSIIKHLIIPELHQETGKRVLIQAYASPQEDVLNGDRRVALSRALNIRRHLIENNITASRVDVRAIGAKTNIQPLDRVELILQ